MSENNSESTSPAKRKFSSDENKFTDEESGKRRKSGDSEPSTSVDDVVVKTEKVDNDPCSEAVSNGNHIPVTVKTEPAEESDPTALDSSSSIPEPSTSSTTAPVVVKKEPENDKAVAESSADSEFGSSSNAAKVAVKTEPDNDHAPAATGTAPDNNPAPVATNNYPAPAATAAPSTNTPKSPVADSSVSSSTLRPSCRFGIRCYRQNPAHRIGEAHPGDSDYRRPSFPAPPLGTPVCPFGNLCYRRNPVHFQQYSHPADFNSAQNIRNRLRQRRAQTQNPNAAIADYSDDDEEEDPFHDDADSDLDYKPGGKEDDDDDGEEDELEFNSERQDCDEYD